MARRVKRVMTVDDSEAMRQMVCITLNGVGYEVVEAEDALDALGKLAENPVDMILVDVDVSKMDCREFVRKVKQGASGKTTPVVFFTSEPQTCKSAYGEKAGAAGWIVKPFKPEYLITTVKMIIG